MGLFSSVFERRSASWGPVDDRWYSDVGVAGSDSGETVTASSAMSCSAVYAAIRNLGEAAGKTPFHLYSRERAGARGKQRAADHPLYDVLRYQANREMTACEFWECLVANAAARGNGYAEIERRRDGAVVGLWPLWSHHMTPKRKAGRLKYHYKDGVLDKVFEPQQIFHLRGFSMGGVVGLNPISVGRQALGVALALQKYVGKFFSNGAHMGGFLQTDIGLSKNARKNLELSIEGWGGLSDAHRVRILEEGLKWVHKGVDPAAAQVLESRTFAILEVCRVFNMQPHKLMELTHATFTNIEHQSQENLQDTLEPWFVRLEQRVRKDVLTKTEQRDYFAEFLRAALLRSDTKSRYEAYAIARTNGWLSADDIRDLENMNPLPGSQGRTYLVALNMVNAESVASGEIDGPSKAGDEAQPENDGSAKTRFARQLGIRNYELRMGERRGQGGVLRLRLRTVWRPVFADAGGRLVRREVKAIRDAMGRFGLRGTGEDDLFRWLSEYYGGEFARNVRQVMGPTFAAYGAEVGEAAGAEIDAGEAMEIESFLEEYLGGFAERHGQSSQGQLAKMLREEMASGDEIEQRLVEWDESRGDKVAANETVRLGDAAAKAVWRLSGITEMGWQASGGACPLCLELDGRVVGIERNFVSAGGEVGTGLDDVATLVVRSNVGHAPLHQGCQCTIVPG